MNANDADHVRRRLPKVFWPFAFGRNFGRPELQSPPLTTQNRSPSSDESTGTLVTDVGWQNLRHRLLPPPSFPVFYGKFRPLPTAVAFVDHTVTFTKLPLIFFDPRPAPPPRRSLEPHRATTVAIGRSFWPNSGHLRQSHRLSTFPLWSSSSHLRIPILAGLRSATVVVPISGTPSALGSSPSDEPNLDMENPTDPNR